jgi:hypothetical protein
LYCFINEIRYVLSQSKPFWIFDGKHTMMAFSFTLKIGIIGFSTMKYQDPVKNVVGSATHPAVCVFGMMILFSVPFLLSIFHLLLVKFLRGYLKFVDINIRDHLVYVMDKTSSNSALFPSAFTITCLAIITACVLDHGKLQRMHIYAILILATLNVGYLYYAGLILYIFEMFLRELSKYTKNMESITRQRVLSPAELETYGTVRRLYANFKLVNHLLTPAIIVGIPLNLSFLCWDFLLKKITYVLLFQITVFEIVVPPLVWSMRSSQVISGRDLQSSKQRSISNGVSSKKNGSNGTSSKMALLSPISMFTKTNKQIKVFPAQYSSRATQEQTSNTHLPV